MRTFKLVRNEDESGVSGTGEVAEGVEFKNGKCVMCWDTTTSSIAVYENVQDLIDIHGHQGKTLVKFEDGQTISDVVQDEDFQIGDVVEIIEANYTKYLGHKAVVVGMARPSNSIRIVITDLNEVQYWQPEWLKKVST